MLRRNIDQVVDANGELSPGGNCYLCANSPVTQSIRPALTNLTNELLTNELLTSALAWPSSVTAPGKHAQAADRPEDGMLEVGQLAVGPPPSRPCLMTQGSRVAQGAPCPHAHTRDGWWGIEMARPGTRARHESRRGPSQGGF